MDTAPRVRLLIVDDSALIREGLKSTLQSYSDLDIVGEASNGEEALLAVSQLKPTAP